MPLRDLVDACEGFDWDYANVHKNCDSHGVTAAECEQVFFNIPLLLSDDLVHGDSEDGYLVLGRSDSNRKLFLVFTVRGKLIRVISARDMTKRERGFYESRK
jgi:uncharacterized DUF497 family protein